MTSRTTRTTIWRPRRRRIRTRPTCWTTPRRWWEKIERQTPATSPTNADTLTWRVTFSESVINVNGGDFEIAGTTASLVATAMTGSTSVYEVAASGGNLADLDGEVTLALAGTNDIKDNADNDLSTAAPNPNETYVLDNTAPTVEKIERQTPATSATNADSLTWLVTFSESVINVNGADFEIAGTTASLVATAMTGSTSVYEVTASGGNLADLEGTVTLTVAGTNDIKDNADNDLDTTETPVPNDNTYDVDNTRPTVTIMNVPTSSNGAFPATFTFNEAVNGFALDDIEVGNGSASAFTGADGGTEYTAQITPTDSGDVTVDVEAGVATDLAGNGNTAATRGDLQLYAACHRHHRADGDEDRAPNPGGLSDQRGHPDLARDLQRGRD